MAEWVADRPILDLCMKTEEPAGGGWPGSRWWHQVVPLQQEEDEVRQTGGVGDRDRGELGGNSSGESDGESRAG